MSRGGVSGARYEFQEGSCAKIHPAGQPGKPGTIRIPGPGVSVGCSLGKERRGIRILCDVGRSARPVVPQTFINQLFELPVSQIILHPLSAELRERVAALRAELALLLEKRMRITFEELPAIRYRYTELFGDLEREIERRTLEMSERKRLVELFALKLDRGQKLDAKMIELTMKAVYKEFERIRMRVVREAGKESRRTEGSGWWIPDTTTSDGASQPRRKKEELRSLYRRLAKRLHPDTGNASNPLAAAWWELVQRSYERGDLNGLQTMANIVETSGGRENRTPRDESPQRLEEEITRLEREQDLEMERLRGLKEAEPYSLKGRLRDEGWIDEKRAALSAELKSLDEEVAKCDRFLAPILAGRGEEVRPETVQNMWSNFLEDVYLSGRY